MVQGSDGQFSKYNLAGRLVLLCTLVPIIALLGYHYVKYNARNEIDVFPNLSGKSHRRDHNKILGLTNNHRALTTAEVIQDQCADQWTGENLPGRCWGLTTSTSIPHIGPGIGEKAASSVDECKKLCCDLGDKCITWQFWGASGICKAGKTVRVGGEGGNTPRWCEPDVPQKWNGGKRNVTSNPLQNDANPNWKAPSTCEWAGQQAGQCFGLGPERLNAEGGRMSASECAAGCCANPHCRLWQHVPLKGCFFNKDALKEDPHCDQYSGAYIGGRKKLK